MYSYWPSITFRTYTRKYFLKGLKHSQVMLTSLFKLIASGIQVEAVEFVLVEMKHHEMVQPFLPHWALQVSL